MFAGSWIQHNFGIWIGHHECNRAWDLLFQIARAPAGCAKERREDAGATRPRPGDELRIAEGSDWFWWFGDSHSSAQDGLFDRLFRKHLQNIYTVLGDPPPNELTRPISQGHRTRGCIPSRRAC